MRLTRIRALGAASLLLSMVAACAAPEPFVYHRDEFNRELPTFRQEPTTISSVVVCYGTRGTTPADVIELAAAECARYGKQARFSYQDYFICPLMTPVSAHYACEAAPPGQTPIPR